MEKGDVAASCGASPRNELSSHIFGKSMCNSIVMTTKLYKWQRKFIFTHLDFQSSKQSKLIFTYLVQIMISILGFNLMILNLRECKISSPSFDSCQSICYK